MQSFVSNGGASARKLDAQKVGSTPSLDHAQPPEDATRSCLRAISLARRMDPSERDVGDIYYATLLQHVGCTAYAYETAALFGGNDIAVKAGGARIDVTLRALLMLLFGQLKNSGSSTVALEVLEYAIGVYM